MAQFEIHKLSNMEPQEIDLELMGMSWSEKAVDIGEVLVQGTKVVEK